MSRKSAALTLNTKPQADSRGSLIYCLQLLRRGSRVNAPSGENGVTRIAPSGVTTVLKGAPLSRRFRRPPFFEAPKNDDYSADDATVLNSMGRDESRKTPPRHPRSRDDFSYLLPRPQRDRRAREPRRTCGHRARAYRQIALQPTRGVQSQVVVAAAMGASETVFLSRRGSCLPRSRAR